MRYSRTAISAIATVAMIGLSGCMTTKSAIKPQPETIPVIETVAVATGCIPASGLPVKPKTLAETYAKEQWTALAPGAKAAAIKAQAGARMNYEDALRAATSGCK